MASLAPSLLLSMPQLTDENFERTVVLLCEHSSEGAFGLVVNRPTTVAAAEVVPFDPPIETTRGPLLWQGGPVDPELGWILLGEEIDEPGQREIAPGLFVSTSLALLRRVVLDTPAHLRVLTGYAGWGPGQLDAEMAASAWLTLDVDPGLIFETPADEMWTLALRRLGADPGALQLGHGVH